MVKNRYKASLDIVSETLTAEYLINLFDIEPDIFYEKGSRRFPRSPISPFSVWGIDSIVPEENDLKEHIEDLASFIEENIDKFNQISDQCKITISCGFFAENEQNGMFLIDKELCKRLSAFPVDFVVLMYPPTPIPQTEPD